MDVHVATRDWDLSAYLRIRRLRDAVLRPVSRPLGRLGVSPSVISLLGVGFAATILHTLDRSPRLALLAFLGALVCDAADGALARQLGAESSSGKIVDHACDTATFLLVLLAIHGHVLGSALQTATCALLAPLLLLVAIYARRRRRQSSEPAGGILAHLYKLPVYGALLLYLGGGSDLLQPAIKLAIVVALASLGLLLVGLERRPGTASEILRG